MPGSGRRCQKRQSTENAHRSGEARRGSRWREETEGSGGDGKQGRGGVSTSKSCEAAPTNHPARTDAMRSLLARDVIAIVNYRGNATVDFRHRDECKKARVLCRLVIDYGSSFIENRVCSRDSFHRGKGNRTTIAMGARPIEPLGICVSNELSNGKNHGNREAYGITLKIKVIFDNESRNRLDDISR